MKKTKKGITISIWRYSHLALAVSSFVFIILASLTGIILAFQPISEQIKPYKTVHLNTVTVAETLGAFHDKYTEILEITVDENDFVRASVITNDDENLEGYFNPKTAEYLGETLKPSPFFQWVTNFHRSLFLKGVGRFFVGLCSFLLFLIALTGTVLVVKRQRGIKRFFSRVVNESFNQYWHVVIGRLSLIPIIIITATGVYLSLEKFNLLPEKRSSHHINFDELSEEPRQEPSTFTIFKATTLSEVKSLEFPFSEDIEDYFTLKLKSKELVINQFNGEILSEIQQPTATVFYNLSLTLHTGKGTIAWAIILAIASVNILFFVYSGFSMTFKRTKTKLKNKYNEATAEIVILVGSENGSTVTFANQFYKALLKAGKRAFISEMNTYTQYPNLAQLVVFTATYGQGEAPTNASQFLELLKTIRQTQAFGFSVVGFGSYAYPDFCQFAIDVDEALEQTENAHRETKLHTVNDKSLGNFQQFVTTWGEKQTIPLDLDTTTLQRTPKALKPLSVFHKTIVETQPDNTFLLTLKPQKRLTVSSGDFLAVYPEKNHRERLYSIGKVNNMIQLSVKYYETGLGSNYLNGLSKGDTLKAKIIQNKGFHFPQSASQVLLIANGTGIAPFLGMLYENKNTKTHLYFGLRGQASYQLYQEQIDGFIAKGKLGNLNLALSQEGNKQYVQDLLLKDEHLVAQVLSTGGCIMICGSLAMQESVWQTLETIRSKRNLETLAFYHKNKQIKTDCY